MIRNLRAKNHAIRHKVYTSQAMDEILALTEQWNDRLLRQPDSHDVECLYEIKIGKNLYSGLNKDELRKHFHNSGHADLITIILRKERVPSATDQHKAPVEDIRTEFTLNSTGDSYFRVTGEDAQLVDGIYNQFMEHHERVPNRNRIMNSDWLEMFVQVAFVILLTITAMFFANHVGYYVDVANSEIYIFIIIFLFFSNVWGYVLKALKETRTALYPVVDIRLQVRPRRSLAIALFLLLSAVSWAVSYLLTFLFVDGANI